MESVYHAINKQVANYTLLYTKLHNYHWNVKGVHFFTLHELFENYYNETTDQLDEMAERLLSIGGTPIGTLKETLELASIQEASGSEDSSQMVETLISDFGVLAKEAEKIMEVADEATGDLFLGIKQGMEKRIWMLNSYLQ
ncbi:Dps family protein [Bacillus sp. 1P06AnD]|uniref:Dps family protein n=1 Tax=Bacillus sp. 1P06AnD TaxID=3132208 RepID=UPI0039A0FCDB